MGWNSLSRESALGAIFGRGLVGTWPQVHHQRSVERRQRRERWADAVADFVKLLEEALPVRNAFRRVPSSEVIEPLLERHAEVRSQLLALAVGHPSRKVRDLARGLDEATRSSIMMTGAWIDLRELGMVDGVEESRSISDRDYQKAQGLLEDLITAI